MFVMRIFFTAALLAFLLTITGVRDVEAMSITPARRVITVDPGKVQEIKLRVENDEAIRRDFRLSILGVKQDAAGRPLFGQGFDDAELWVKPNVPTLALASGESKEVSFALSVPAGTYPGSHWVALAVETIPGQENRETELNERLVSLVSIQVAGVVEESAVLSTDFGSSVAIGSGSLPLTVKFANTGTIEIPLSGKIILRSLKGAVLSEQDFGLGNQLLPKAERSIEEKIIPGSVENCAGQEANHLCFGLNLPGLYRLETLVTYGKTEQVITSNTSFWYFPVWFFGVVAGIIFVIMGVGYFIRRTRTFERYVATR